MFQNKSPLHGINWLRVVLDEGHIIRNPNAQMSKAALQLNAQRRWILSGTSEAQHMRMKVLQCFMQMLVFFFFVLFLFFYHLFRHPYPEQCERPVDAAGLPAYETV